MFYNLSNLLIFCNFIPMFFPSLRIKEHSDSTTSAEVISPPQDIPSSITQSPDSPHEGRIRLTALDKLSRVVKTMDRMKKAKSKLGGNLFLDIQLDNFEVSVEKAWTSIIRIVHISIGLYA